MAKHVKQTWTDGAGGSTPVSGARLAYIETGVYNASVDRGTSLPGSPIDGEMYDYLADSTNGVVWRLLYRSGSGSAHKWEYIGGPPLFSLTDTDGTFNSTTYVDPTTMPNATVTVPKAGDYLVRWGFQGGIAVTDLDIKCAVKVGAAATSDLNSTTIVTYNAFGRTLTNNREKVITCAASDVLKLQYRASAAGGVTVFAHWIYATPIRVS